MRFDRSKRLRAGLIAFALVLSQVVVPVQSAYASGGKKDDDKKVYVCKYVGKPGVDEVLKEGKNPIEVSVSSIDNNEWDGSIPGYFSDAQDRSYVLGYVGQTTDLSCPDGVGPQEIPVPMPTVNDPCGLNNATWMVPADTQEIDWTLRQNGTLIAETKEGYIFANGEDKINFGKTVDSNKACDVVIDRPNQPLVNDECGLNNAEWIVPMNSDTVSWSLVDGELVATAASGYVFTGGVSVINFGLAKDSQKLCVIELPEPEVVDECNVEGNNAAWVVPEDTDTYTWSLQEDGSLVVTASADYAFSVDDSEVTSFNYGQPEDSGEECPKEPTQCTVTNNLYNAPWSYDGTSFPVAGASPSGVPGSFSFTNNGLLLSTPNLESYVYGVVGAGQTPIRDIDDMSYMTFREVTAMGNPQTVAAYILLIDRDGNLADSTDQTYLFYEPIYNGTVVTGVWQTWDVDADNAKFWSFELTGGNPTLTWAQIVDQFPNAVALEYGFNQGTYNEGTVSRVQSLVFDCATTAFGVPGSGGEGGVTPTPTPVTPAPVLPAGGQGQSGAAALPAELPLTGSNGSVLSTWIALLAAIVTYGAVYFMQPKKRFDS